MIETDWADVDSIICGCIVCMRGDAIYDGTIIVRKRDGSLVNRFGGEGTERERKIDAVIATLNSSDVLSGPRSGGQGS